MCGKPKSIMTLVAMALMAVSALGILGSAKAQQKGIFPNPVEPKMSARLNISKLSYDAFCAECHGKTGGGTDKGPTFINRIYHPSHHADGAFYLAVKRGARAHH